MLEKKDSEFGGGGNDPENDVLDFGETGGEHVPVNKGDGHKKRGDKKVKSAPRDYDELIEKSKKADEYFDSFLRIRAEFDNYRKRVNKEKASLTAYAVEEVMLDVLGVLDNLERALESGGKTENFDALHKGVEITLKDAVKVLEKWGISEVPALGKHFDPAEHEAFMTVESEEDEGMIIEVLRKGYYIKDKLLRPSLVKVAGRKANG